MKTAERIVIVFIIIGLLGAAAWLYVAVTMKIQDKKDAVARGEYEIHDNAREAMSDDDSVAKWYPQLVPVRIGSTSVQASVADSMSERIKGLSDSPSLPEGVVKLFVFGSGGEQAIWMKDMNYPLDILWADKEGKVVHIEERVAPETYPNSFSSPVPAWYVIEANSGFVASSSIKLGDTLEI